MVGCDELSKPLISLWLAKCDSNGEDMEYGLNDLSIKKRVKISASKTSASKAPSTSSHGA